MGRPRSAEAHNKVIDAAIHLFAERGIDATSMDSIAEASGVSKATIYKHWQDKDALCLEVMAHLHGLHEEPVVFDTGDFRADLIAQLRYHPAEQHKELRDKIMPHMIAYSARNQVVGTQWRARVTEPSRVAILHLLQRGTRSGKLRPGIDPEVALAMLLGPMFFQHIFISKAGRKAPNALEVHVVDGFLAAYGQ